MTSKDKRNKIIIYGLIFLIAFGFLLPIIYMFSISFRVDAELTDLIPTKHTVQHYVDILYKMDFGRYFLNSSIISFCVILILFLLGTIPAYLITRLAMIKTMFSIILFYVAPPIAFLLPMFIMFNKIRLLDTHLSLILALTVRIFPYYIWLMVGYFKEIPREIDEAAMIDGCTLPQAMVKILLPILAPGLIATLIICFVLSWNGLLFALVLTSLKAKTLPVAISGLIGYTSVEWGKLGAASVLTVLPVLLFGVFIQKYLARGFAAGGVKG